MMNELDLLDKRIENYVHKRMSEEEREAFEDEIKNNAQLRENIRSLIELIDLYNAELFDLRARLNETEEKLRDENFFKGEQ